MIDPTKLCQIEIQVSDMERSLEFYREVFGWKKVPAEMFEYAVLEVPPECTFGISLIPSLAFGATNSRLVLYFSVSTEAAIKDIMARAKQWGGSAVFGPKRVPGRGMIYQVADPDGQRFGLYCG